MEQRFYATINSPLGIIEVEANEAAILSLNYVEHHREEQDELPHLKACQAQLKEYFEGTLQTFDLPLNPKGTDFQQKVWNILLTIPYGSTCSYLDIANQLGDANATRAVGAANGNNPIGIIIPCHRVIGSDGKLTGYAGGLPRKQFLLELEGVLPHQPQLF